MADLVPIQPQYNAAIAAIIRNSLAEFGANLPGTVYFDPTTDDLASLFATAGKYWVLVQNGEVLGGGGWYPTPGLPKGYAELVKLYLAPKARGLGYGKLLMNKVAHDALNTGYTQLYLESLPQLHQAVKLYTQQGYTAIDAALGESGHFGCTIFMIKKL
ncbi:MAG: GNAT family N-acetyltransferase [Bacteroidetes bacterium]|nr:MAG: GNAT family N-acetyltransferase [Bacteroidota bacterium]